MEVAYKLSNRYFYIQNCEDGYDFTFYNSTWQEIDGGQLDNPEISITEAAIELITEYFPNCHFEAIDCDYLLRMIE